MTPREQSKANAEIRAAWEAGCELREKASGETIPAPTWSVFDFTGPDYELLPQRPDGAQLAAMGYRLTGECREPGSNEKFAGACPAGWDGHVWGDGGVVPIPLINTRRWIVEPLPRDEKPDGFDECETCRHMGVAHDQPPCNHCGLFGYGSGSKWEAADTRDAADTPDAALVRDVLAAVERYQAQKGGAK